MSTNFYVTLPAHEGACEHCSQPERLHIGQRPSGLQAYAESPFGPIRSIADWRRVLALPDLVIKDEYGQRMTAAEVLAVFEEMSPAQRRRQYDWVHGNRQFVVSPEDWWLDAEGFTFTEREFF